MDETSRLIVVPELPTMPSTQPPDGPESEDHFHLLPMTPEVVLPSIQSHLLMLEPTSVLLTLTDNLLKPEPL